MESAAKLGQFVLGEVVDAGVPESHARAGMELGIRMLTHELEMLGVNSLGVGIAYADQVVFENLVITNGYSDYGGGSRFVASSDVVVRNCHFVGNHADWNGAGVRLSLDTTLTLVDCEIAGNTANHPTWPGQSYGAGIHNGGGTVVLERTRVCGNVESSDPGRQVTGDGPVLVGGCITDDCDSCEVDEMDADLNSDGIVGVNDLLIVIASWGESGSADIDGDGTVGVTDLLVVISLWG